MSSAFQALLGGLLTIVMIFAISRLWINWRWQEKEPGEWTALA